MTHEPVGFSVWVGRHCRAGEHAVPKAGSKRRRMLLAVWEALVAEDIDFESATRGLEGRVPEVALAIVWGDAAARDDPDLKVRAR
jgi:hypothetical protein